MLGIYFIDVEKYPHIGRVQANDQVVERRSGATTSKRNVLIWA